MVPVFPWVLGPSFLCQPQVWGIRLSYSHGEDGHVTFSLLQAWKSLSSLLHSWAPQPLLTGNSDLIRPPPQNTYLFLSPPGSRSGATLEVTSHPSQLTGWISPQLSVVTLSRNWPAVSATTDSEHPRAWPQPVILGILSVLAPPDDTSTLPVAHARPRKSAWFLFCSHDSCVLHYDVLVNSRPIYDGGPYLTVVP